MNSEKTLYESSPAMFRNRPIWFAVCVLLIVAYGLGLVILLLWWIANKGTVLTVTDERTILRRGILAKSTTEVWHRDIRNVQLSQTFLQRIFNVGSIGLSSSGQGGIEIAVDGLPSPNKVKRLIDEQRRDAS
ncbi:MAG: PH domain-containing protein [Planctomycetaceae bacterium]